MSWYVFSVPGHLPDHLQTRKLPTSSPDETESHYQNFILNASQTQPIHNDDFIHVEPHASKKQPTYNTSGPDLNDDDPYDFNANFHSSKQLRQHNHIDNNYLLNDESVIAGDACSSSYAAASKPASSKSSHGSRSGTEVK